MKSALIKTIIAITLLTLVSCQGLDSASDEQKNANVGGSQTATSNPVGSSSEESGDSKSSNAALQITTTQTVSPGDISATKVPIVIGKPLPQSSQEVTPELKKLLELQDQLTEIVATGKLENCRKIVDATYNESCQFYVLTGMAKSKADIAVCDDGLNDKVKESCRNFVSKMK